MSERQTAGRWELTVLVTAGAILILSGAAFLALDSQLAKMHPPGQRVGTLLAFTNPFENNHDALAASWNDWWRGDSEHGYKSPSTIIQVALYVDVVIMLTLAYFLYLLHKRANRKLASGPKDKTTLLLIGNVVILLYVAFDLAEDALIYTTPGVAPWSSHALIQFDDRRVALISTLASGKLLFLLSAVVLIIAQCLTGSKQLWPEEHGT